MTDSDVEENVEKCEEVVESEISKPIRKKRRKRKLNYPPEIKENPKLRKYFAKRFTLFSKFEEGIKLDEGRVHYFKFSTTLL